MPVLQMINMKSAGAKVLEKVEDIYNTSDIIFKVQRPLEHPQFNKNEIDLMKKGTLLITFLYPLHYVELVKQCAQKGINVISMDMIPRTTLAQKMDALSSQANICRI